MIIWLTGLSGSGKTTLATALYSRLKQRLPQVVLLDGDAIRATISNDLAFDESARTVQIGRVQRLAKLLSDQNLIVIVAVVYAHPTLLHWNRENIKDYFEVYLNASLDTVKGRDSKGLYAGKPNVVGIDIPWHAPTNPNMTFDQNKPMPSDVMAERIVTAIPALAQVYR